MNSFMHTNFINVFCFFIINQLVLSPIIMNFDLYHYPSSVNGFFCLVANAHDFAIVFTVLSLFDTFPIVLLGNPRVYRVKITHAHTYTNNYK